MLSFSAALPVICRQIWVTAALIVLVAFALPATALAVDDTFAIIDNGVVQLGVNDEGDLNVDGPPSSGGTPIVGLRYVPTNADSTSPGCTCEGWGVADGDASATPGPNAGVFGAANTANDGGLGQNLAVVSFTHDALTAVSVVNVLDSSGAPVMQVTHDYHPSAETPNLYEVVVSVTNLTGAPIAKLLYRRVMDWDVEPTAFDEFSTIDGAHDSAFLKFSSDNGFASANPLAGPSDIGVTGFFTDNGPADHGALFDFDFGELPALETRTFTTYYGAAGNEIDALAATSAVSAEIWSLGQPNTPDGPTIGTPNTFVFAFGGVGGSGFGTDNRPPATLKTVAPTRLPVGTHEFDVSATMINTGTAGAMTGVSASIALGEGLTLGSGATPTDLGSLDQDATSGAATWHVVAPVATCVDQEFSYTVTGDWAERAPGDAVRSVARTVTVPGTCGTIFGNVTAGNETDGFHVVAGAAVTACRTDTDPPTCGSDTSDASGNYEIPDIGAGPYRVDVHPPTDGPDADDIPQSATLTLAAGGSLRQDFTLSNLKAPPAGSTVGGEWSHTGDDGIPVINWTQPPVMQTTGCPGGTAHYQITQGDPVVTVLLEGDMTEDPGGSGTYTAAAASGVYPAHGYAKVSYLITCPDASTESVAFDIYIDPSGFVKDTADNPVVGAKVTLYRSETETGELTVVPDGSAIMSPANRTNPDTTDSTGHFGWDVTKGYYMVRAENSGCHAPGHADQAYVETARLAVPPPVTDLKLVLDCTPPVAAATPTTPATEPPPTTALSTSPTPPVITSDTTAPVLSVGKIKAIKLRVLLKKGMKLSSTCSERCTMTAKFVLDGRTAKKLHLSKKAKALTIAIARGSGLSLTLTLKLKTKAKKALAHVAKVRIVLVVTSRDSAGNTSRAVKRQLTFKR